MGRQRHSRTEPHGGVSNIAPCKRGRAARSLGYRPHPQQIAAEQQISQSQICYAVATSLKLTFYPTLHGATHRLHGATSETVLCTSWLRCSSPLRATGAMGRRFLCKQSASRLVTAVSTAVACRQLTSLRRYISRPRGVLWEGGTLLRSLACGSTTRYYLATPDGVCSSHHSELLIPNYTLLRPLAGRRTIARSGALARLRDIATPTFQDPSWVARRMHIGAMGRRQAAEPLRGSLIDNPTLTRQRLCGESRMTHIYNAVGVAFIHEATKQHLRRCFAPSSHLPHIVAALQCGAIYKATARRLALNHENSLFY